MCRLGLCLLTVALLLALPNRSQGQTTDDVGLWFAALGNGKLSSERHNSLRPDNTPWRWWFDSHYRLLEDADGFNQSIVRPGVGYSFAEDQVLWAGYGWIHSSPILGSNFDEHRFWQQWTAAPSQGDLKYLFRSRFEQRWLETGDDVGLRWRQMMRAQKVLSTHPEWSLVAWDEAFFHLNDTDWGANAGFDQNRLFIGLGFKRCKHAAVRTEIGYLNQFGNSQGGTDRMNHILSINFFY